MTPMTRRDVAYLANSAAEQSRLPGAPRLRPNSNPRDVVAWLMWNDPNGIHEYRPHATAEELEERDYYTTEAEVWEALADMLADL